MIVSPMLLGGALPWTIVLIASLASVWLGLAVWAAVRRRLDAQTDAVTLVMTFALVWTGLQLVPLPIDWTWVLAPESATESVRAARALDASSPDYVPITRDPGSTRRELVKGAAILASFGAAWILAALRYRKALLRLAGASVATMALVALGHRAAEAQRVFGLYEPELVSTRRLSPLLNENHLGGFLAMGLPLLLGLGLDHEERPRRALWLTLAAIVGGAAMLSVSRAAVGATVGGGVLFVAAMWLLDRKRRSRHSAGSVSALQLAAAGTVAVGLGLGGYTTADAILQSFETEDTQKLAVASKGLEMTLDHFWHGVGRGGYASAFSEYMGSTHRFTHPENLPVQWASEWGVPVALALLATLVVVLVQRFKKVRGYAHLGAIVAVVTMAVQNLVDFGLEMAGITAVAAPLLAVAIVPRESRGSERGRRKRRSSSERRSSGNQERNSDRDSDGGGVRGLVSRLAQRLPSARTTGMALLPLVALLTLGFGPSLPSTSIDGFTERLQRQLEHGKSEGFAQTLQRAVALHPAEPEITSLAAAEALRRGDPAAVRWLNRTMALAPEWPWPHLATAKWLYAQGRTDQTLLEIREAEERRAGIGKGLMCRILKKDGRAELVQRAAPRDGSEHDLFLDRVVETCGSRDAGWAQQIDHQLLEQDTRLLGPRLRQADRLRGEGKMEAAIAMLAEAIDQHPESKRAYRALAEVHLKREKPNEAVRVLERYQRRADARPPMLRQLARAQAANGDVEGMRATIEDLRRFAAGHPKQLASVESFRAQLERKLDNEGRALRALEDAHRLHPRPAVLAKVASLAEKLGDRRRAYEAYSKLCDRRVGDKKYCAAAGRIRQSLTEPAFRSSQRSP